MLGEFSSEAIPLTIRNPETGRLLTARVYTIEGLEGEFSMGQLVMAICLSRAADVEAELIEIMNDVDRTSEKLDTLTQIQNLLVKWFDEHGVNDPFNFDFGGGTEITYNGRAYTGTEWRDFLWEVCEMTEEQVPAGETITKQQVESLIDTVSDKMDSYNSVSQDQLIQMESWTAKRDQTYDMVTNILKALNSQLMGNAGNL